MDVNSFDLVAPFYDRLSKVVFRDQLLNAQLVFLNQIKSTDAILVLGGGTGEFLDHMPNSRSINFLEKSKRMIARARQRKNIDKVSFINEDFLTWETRSTYDVVVCPFFLDCFSDQNLRAVLNKIRTLLKNDGKLIVTDFQSTESNSFQLSLMHHFFRISSNLDAEFLLDINQKVIEEGFKLMEEKFLYRNRLFSRLYRNL